MSRNNKQNGNNLSLRDTHQQRLDMIAIIIIIKISTQFVPRNK